MYNPEQLRRLKLHPTNEAAKIIRAWDLLDTLQLVTPSVREEHQSRLKKELSLLGPDGGEFAPVDNPNNPGDLDAKDDSVG